MIEPVAQYALYFSVSWLEVALLVLVLSRRVWRRFAGPFLYVLLMLAADGFLRPLALHSYGSDSVSYFNVYGCTDAALALATLLLACAFIRRAARHHPDAQTLYVVLMLSLADIPRYFVGQHRNWSERWIDIINDLSFSPLCSFVAMFVLSWIVLRPSARVEAEFKLLVAGLAVQLAGVTIISYAFSVFSQNASDDVAEFASGIFTLFFLLLWWRAVMLSSSPSRPAWSKE